MIVQRPEGFARFLRALPHDIF